MHGLPQPVHIQITFFVSPPYVTLIMVIICTTYYFKYNVNCDKENCWRESSFFLSTEYEINQHDTWRYFTCNKFPISIFTPNYLEIVFCIWTHLISFPICLSFFPLEFYLNLCTAQCDADLSLFLALLWALWHIWRGKAEYWLVLLLEFMR